MLRLRVHNIAHPGIRQFILRTAVVNYLGKCLQLQWDDWQQQLHLCTLHLGCSQQSNDAKDPNCEAAAGQEALLLQDIEELREKVFLTHKLLEREYNELFIYMMDKRDLWDSPEYFKAKTALGTANHNLRMFMPAEQ